MLEWLGGGGLLAPRCDSDADVGDDGHALAGMGSAMSKRWQGEHTREGPFP